MINRQIAERSGYPVKNLVEVVEFLDHRRRPVKESERVGGPYPYYGANGKQGSIDKYIFDEELVLLAEDGGHFANPARGIAYRIGGKSWVNNHAHVLRPRACIDIGYLCRILENYDVIPFVNGTTRSKLTKAGASEIPIPLPPLDEQKRIAAILDKADALRRQRRQALTLLDSLTQSIFLEMFGDPVSNPNNFPLMKVGDVADKYSDGPFGSNLKSMHYVDQGIRVIRLQNIGVGEFIDNDRAYISEGHFNKITKHECRPGDVLIGTLGDPNLRACVQPDWLTCAINKADCVQLRVNKNFALSDYFSCLLNQKSTMEMVQSLVLGQTRGRISMGRLRNLELPIASLPLQSKFVSVVRVHEQQKQSLQESAHQLDSLFASLQHRAFSGQL